MTITTPHTGKRKTGFVALSIALLLCGGVFSVFEYARLVVFRHEVKGLRSAIENEESKNLALTDELYGRLDSNALKQIAEASNLVMEKDPIYIRLGDTAPGNSIVDKR